MFNLVNTIRTYQRKRFVKEFNRLQRIRLDIMRRDTTTVINEEHYILKG